jgi:hypothetical protein
VRRSASCRAVPQRERRQHDDHGVGVAARRRGAWRRRAPGCHLGGERGRASPAAIIGPVNSSAASWHRDRARWRVLLRASPRCDRRSHEHLSAVATRSAALARRRSRSRSPWIAPRARQLTAVGAVPADPAPGNDTQRVELRRIARSGVRPAGEPSTLSSAFASVNHGRCRPRISRIAGL